MEQRQQSEQNYSEIFDLRGHSYNEASALCPNARQVERSTLIDLLKLSPLQTVADAPAGGGYLADGIRLKFGDQVRIICIEPSKKFGAAIESSHHLLWELQYASGYRSE